jgi:hypothetical protein
MIAWKTETPPSVQPFLNNRPATMTMEPAVGFRISLLLRAC